ncbi:MAG TPA: aminoacyl-tRNA hydrolase [Halanaerobiales bacterium]|nr:aminoacyl-tRNA hydrolase [Halanaerobiales bacterium]
MNLKLIVGLGNPGEKYSETRHNVGFMAIKQLAEEFNILNVDKDCEALVADGKIEDTKVILAQPLTYMNKSGRAVSKLIDKYDISLKDLIVIYDDLDLPAGKIRIKGSGGSGGHKGIKSIIEYMDSNEITRIRIGIGRPLEIDVTEYVLHEFNEDQIKRINQALKKVDDIILELIKDDLDSAMNKFN